MFFLFYSGITITIPKVLKTKNPIKLMMRFLSY